VWCPYLAFARQDSLSADYDAVVDRKNDLIYHDRTLFDERMAILITDYVNIVNSLIKLAEDNKVKKALVDGILEQQADTRNFSTGKHLKYTDLIKHMVSVEQVIRIERKNDAHSIANKTFDFSSTTIKNLIRDGYEETLEQETSILQVWDSEHPRQANVSVNEYDMAFAYHIRTLFPMYLSWI